ncbi:meteorin-like protein [Littorina saxatilis]|uniref:Meteorin-like protein n=1 Tax=Littorina saxatilis TaxID=31220 RepID=A0AAN9GLQ9_9CAEN
MDIYQFLSALLVLVIQGYPGWAQDTCDQCDCKLSSNDDKRAIFNVRTRCNTGAIEWSSAYGAIRLEVQPSVAGDFRLCIVVDSHHTVTQVSQEAPRTRRLKNYRLGLEELRLLSMSPLVSVGEGERSGEVCVSGRTRQPVLLFVEVERTNRFTGIPSVTLRYDVESLSDAMLYDPMEECRPCTQEEVLEAYCTSDFVAVGSMHKADEDSGTDHTKVQVAVAQLIHQNSPVFNRVRRDDRYLYGTIHVPGKCGVKAGKGDFLFTGRMRLGKPKLRCAPFFKDWLRISSLAECVYN